MTLGGSKRRVLITGTVAGLVAGGLWWGYAWAVPGMAGPSTTAAADAASGKAHTAARQRLDETMAALPAGWRPLGGAEADRCLRDGPFEGAGPGLLQCQWELAQYVVVDGADLGATGKAWSAAVTGHGWNDAWRGAPAGWTPPAGRYEFDDPQTRQHLVVRLIGSQADLGSLQDTRNFEGVQSYERDRRGFTGRAAAAQALAEGRTVAQVSLTDSYYREDGGDPVPVN
ncbi:hypothetical protein GCM10010441_00520 [Kitasatospora paracochleata]|uniref:Uncharacterized protein n=1 Tax=Kitasatospora paracochleata TaxID=58354 RepID=A0ABT1J6L1_9ACTN|nr:hypothetical protein [Kitasatospora paracochleata]MCP2312691.1 hypothetical protein [Kitasatospora paracochleata]